MNNLRDGFFISEDRDTFAILNGSMFQVESIPEFAQLEPGYYAEDGSFIGKAFDPNQPRDDKGRWSATGAKALSEDDLDKFIPRWGDLNERAKRKRLQDAVERWMGPEYIATNKALRDSRGDSMEWGTGPHQTLIHRLDQTFREAGHTLDEDIVVYRGIDKDAALQLEPGQTFRDYGFVSTSPWESDASSFLEGEEGGVLMRITVPKGARVFSPFVQREDGPGRAELELLLPRGNSFTVKASRGTSNGNRLLEVEMVKPGAGMSA